VSGSAAGSTTGSAAVAALDSGTAATERALDQALLLFLEGREDEDGAEAVIAAALGPSGGGSAIAATGVVAGELAAESKQALAESQAAAAKAAAADDDEGEVPPAAITEPIARLRALRVRAAEALSPLHWTVAAVDCALLHHLYAAQDAQVRSGTHMVGVSVL
jgi:hypothetical protein